MCEKISYESFFEAEKRLSRFKKGRSYTGRRKATKKPKRAYKCKFCGLYHLTSQKKID